MALQKYFFDKMVKISNLETFINHMAMCLCIFLLLVYQIQLSIWSHQIQFIV